MIELALLIPTLILGYLLWRSDRRYDEAEQAWRLERAGLLTRIQAPERAIINDFEPNDIRHVPWEDDEAFWKAKAMETEQ